MTKKYEPRTEGEKRVYEELGAEKFGELIEYCKDYALEEIEYAKSLGKSLDSDKLIGLYIWNIIGETNSQISSIKVRTKWTRLGNKPDLSGLPKFLSPKQREKEIKRRYEIKSRKSEKREE